MVYNNVKIWKHVLENVLSFTNMDASRIRPSRISMQLSSAMDLSYNEKENPTNNIAEGAQDDQGIVPVLTEALEPQSQLAWGY